MTSLILTALSAICRRRQRQRLPLVYYVASNSFQASTLLL